MDNYVPIDLDDDVTYAGDTEQEKILNKELLKTTLELNRYQDSYDVMKDINDIKARVEHYRQVQQDEYIPPEIIQEYDARIEELEWVLNGSRTAEEKWDSISVSSKEEVTKIIKHLNETYKQLSIFDIMEKNEKNNK